MPLRFEAILDFSSRNSFERALMHLKHDLQHFFNPGFSIGGLSTFGVIGIVLGPLIIVFLITLFNIYEMKEGIFDRFDHIKEK